LDRFTLPPNRIIPQSAIVPVDCSFSLHPSPSPSSLALARSRTPTAAGSASARPAVLGRQPHSSSARFRQLLSSKSPLDPLHPRPPAALPPRSESRAHAAPRSLPLCGGHQAQATSRSPASTRPTQPVWFGLFFPCSQSTPAAPGAGAGRRSTAAARYPARHLFHRLPPPPLGPGGMVPRRGWIGIPHRGRIELPHHRVQNSTPFVSSSTTSVGRLSTSLVWGTTQTSLPSPFVSANRQRKARCREQVLLNP
jgi:hypothetical protein